MAINFFSMHSCRNRFRLKKGNTLSNTNKILLRYIDYNLHTNTKKNFIIEWCVNLIEKFDKEYRNKITVKKYQP